MTGLEGAMGPAAVWAVLQCVFLVLAVLGAASAFFVRGCGRWIPVSVLLMAGYFAMALLGGWISWWSVALLTAGALLLALETVVPGGIVGILGMLAVAAALYLSTPTPVYMCIQIGGALLLCGAVLPLLRRKRGARNLLAAFTNEEVTPGARETAASDGEWLGRSGTARTPLRPVGTAAFGETERDVMSDGGFIPAGAPVTVIGVRDGRLLVRMAEKDA